MPVYNLEVEGDHVYRVGQSGVLVHNMSAPAKGDEEEPCPDPNELFKDLKLPKSYKVPQGTTEEILENLKKLVSSKAGYAILVIGGSAYMLKTPNNSTPAGSDPDAPIEWGSGYVPNEAVDIGIGFNTVNRHHTDASAAALLRMLAANGKQVKEAILYGIPRPCTKGDAGCAPNLKKMLPKGTTLKVFWIATEATTRTGEESYPGEG